MILRGLIFSGLFLLGGCAVLGVNSNSIGVVTEEYGQCVASTKEDGPRFDRKEITFICPNKRVLLGWPYEKEGETYMDSALLYKKEGRYYVKDKQPASVIEGLHNVCQLKPSKGEGNETIRAYYFDMRLKACRPFIWSGKGGFVPFKSMDACEQYCEH